MMSGKLHRRSVWFLSVVMVLGAGALASADDLVKLDDLDGDDNLVSTSWWSGCDKNGLGTVLMPDPFRPSEGGSPTSPKRFARINGHFGKSQSCAETRVRLLEAPRASRAERSWRLASRFSP
jgi:hypothetical protein